MFLRGLLFTGGFYDTFVEEYSGYSQQHVFALSSRCLGLVIVSNDSMNYFAVREHRQSEALGQHWPTVPPQRNPQPQALAVKVSRVYESIGLNLAS